MDKDKLRERISTTIDALCGGSAMAAASFWQDILDYTQAQVDEAVREAQRKHKETHVCRQKPKPNPYRHNHVCIGCSLDGKNPGPGCINCRNTGMEQMPCVLFDKCPGPKDIKQLTIQPKDNKTEKEGE